MLDDVIQIVPGDSMALVEDGARRQLRIEAKRDVVAYLADLLNNVRPDLGPALMAFNVGLPYPQGSVGAALNAILTGIGEGGPWGDAPTLVQALEGLLTEGSLNASLRDRINKIDDPVEGLVAAVAALEAELGAGGGSAAAAAASAAAAAQSAIDAAEAENQAAIAAGDALTKANEAATSRTQAQTAASNASASQTAAANSATSAAGSASSASTSASTAATAASNAGTSASAAATSATSASTSATNAATSATASQASRLAAESAAGNASASQTAAASSATTASGAASTATTQAGIATTAASNAGTSATAASTSASNAASSASAAATSASASQTARLAAETAQSSASTSASNAATSATNAQGSASSAASSASAAASSQSAALGSANAAATSASTALTHANAAGTSASAADGHRVTAQTAASSASTSATNAASSATAADGSATAAASHYNNTVAATGALTASVSSLSTAVAGPDGVQSQYVLKVAATRTDGKKVFGAIALAATANTDATGGQSEIMLVADKLVLLRPGDLDGPTKQAFVVGTVNGVTTVVANAAVFGDLSVGTLAIANQAITIPVAVSSGTFVSHPTVMTIGTPNRDYFILELTIVSTGAPIVIQGGIDLQTIVNSVLASGLASVVTNVFIKRRAGVGTGGTPTTVRQMYAHQVKNTSGSSSNSQRSAIAVPPIIDQPGAGTWTYTLELSGSLFPDGDGNCSGQVAYSGRGLLALEVKK